MRGFTLLEQMVVLSIVSIVFFIAVPSYTNYLQKNRSNVMANQLVTDLNLARVNALSSGTAVTLCPWDAAQPNVCAQTPNWEKGWVAYSSPSNETSWTSGTQISESHYEQWTGVMLMLTPATMKQVVFNSLGALQSEPFTLIFQPKECLGEQAQMVTVSESGSVNLVNVACVAQSS